MSAISALFDKLFPSNQRKELTVSKMSGAQSFSSSSCVYNPDMPSDYYWAIFGKDQPNQQSEMSTNAKKNFIRSVRNAVLYPLPKLLPTTFKTFAQDCFRTICQSKSVSTHYTAQGLSILCEAAMAEHNFVTKAMGLVPVPQLQEKRVEPPKQFPRKGTNVLDHELANRKTKELQKRSKKRRRRQKKLARNPSPKSDIVCDIVDSVQMLLPRLSSFVISVESCDSDSDYDRNNDDWFTDISAFEVTGLCLSNLSSSNVLTSSSRLNSSKENKEVRRRNCVLSKINRAWNEAMKCVDRGLRSVSKVSFSQDIQIVTVEMYERKGEWEEFAVDRQRFQRRIKEAEKIISPCLTEEHRNGVYLKLYGSRQ